MPVARALKTITCRPGREMFERTSIPDALVHRGRRLTRSGARLNCIDHLLNQIPYQPVPHEEINLRARAIQIITRHALPGDTFRNAKPGPGSAPGGRRLLTLPGPVHNAAARRGAQQCLSSGRYPKSSKAQLA